MIRRSAGAWLTLLLLSATGCSALQDQVIDCETSIRNHVLAQKAWGEWSWCYDELDYPYHFAKGFKAGYRNILEGGNGCQPSLPPKCYWKPHYQSPEGRAQIAAWFDGYSHGALAAEQDGMGSIGHLPISPTARANIIAKKAPVNPACFNGMYHGEVPEATPEEIAEEMELELPGQVEAAPEGVPPMPEGEIKKLAVPYEK